MLEVKSFEIAGMTIGGDKMTLIAGPCSIEGYEMCDEVAGELVKVCRELDINYIFKGSFDKANRSNLHAGRGVGMGRVSSYSTTSRRSTAFR